MGGGWWAGGGGALGVGGIPKTKNLVTIDFKLADKKQESAKAYLLKLGRKICR